MLKSHNQQLIAEAQIFDKSGKLLRTEKANVEEQKDNEIEITTYNEDGSPALTKTFPFRSFTSNFLKYLYRMFTDTTVDPDPVKETGVSNNDNYSYMSLEGDYGIDHTGIIVGRSSNAVDIDDYELVSKCSHGTSTNQLEYSFTKVYEPETVSSNYLLKIRRMFANYSGTSINVREVGILCNTSATASTSTNTYLISRDILNEDTTPIDIAIADNQSFSVTFNIYHTVASGFTGNYFKTLYGLFSEEYNYGVVFTSGAVNSSNLTSNFHTFFDTATPAYGDSSYGILVGRGNTAISLTDYQMDDQIAHGSSADQLLYWEQEFTSPIVGASDTSFQLKRTFYNDTSSDIDIEEAGVYGYNGGAADETMLIRVVFPTAITLQATESVKIIFTFKTEV